MMRMKPPHYQGIRHAGRKLKDGESAEVAPRDVAALEAAGWTEDKPPKKRRTAPRHSAITTNDGDES